MDFGSTMRSPFTAVWAAVEAACRDCPANALAEHYAFEQLTDAVTTLAGCYGARSPAP